MNCPVKKDFFPVPCGTCIFFLLLFCSLFPAFSDTSYVVEKGETLYSISKKYSCTVAALCLANNISDATAVKAGQKIIIPGSDETKTVSSSSAKQNSTKYTVQKGETWYGIAHKFGITVHDLQKLNNATASASLKTGQKISVPVISDNPVQSAGSPADTVTDIPQLKPVDPHVYSSKKGDATLIWPVQTPVVIYMSGKVSGVRLSAAKDEPVTAIRAGTVMFSGSYRGFGNVVFIQSKTGHIYAYTGLGSITVNKGDYVSFGNQVGTVGIDSYSGISQMSLMVFQNGLPIDPAKAPRG
jgi:lipoprotein YgeR